MHHPFITYLFLVLLAFCALSIENKDNQWNTEIEQRDKSRGNLTFTEQYAFYLKGQSIFSVTPQVDEIVRGEISIFWNINQLFVPAQYNPGQEVRVIVQSNDKKTIVDASFYILAGFTFNALKGQEYTITILPQGKIQKMAIMKYDIKGVKVEGLKSGQVNLSTLRLKQISNQIRVIMQIFIAYNEEWINNQITRRQNSKASVKKHKKLHGVQPFIRCSFIWANFCSSHFYQKIAREKQQCCMNDVLIDDLNINFFNNVKVFKKIKALNFAKFIQAVFNLQEMSVLIETSFGDIVIDLYYEKAPKACLNFVKLCTLKHYNNSLFFQVQKDYIAKVKPEKPTTIWFQQGAGEQYFDDQIDMQFRMNKLGLVATANNGANKNNSQFFITLSKAHLTSLNGKHTVFGKVEEGFDILKKINQIYVDKSYRPRMNIRVLHTFILQDPYPQEFKNLKIPASPKMYNDSDRLEVTEHLDLMNKSKTQKDIIQLNKEQKSKKQATTLEIIGALPDANVKPPQNVLFVCKLNPITQQKDLEIIFSRFGMVKSVEIVRDWKTGQSLQYGFIQFDNSTSCQQAYLKMENVLIDDRRIHVDFSQSVSKLTSKPKQKQIIKSGESRDKKKGIVSKLQDGKYSYGENKYDYVVGKSSKRQQNLTERRQEFYQKRQEYQNRKNTKQEDRSRSKQKNKNNNKQKRRSRSRERKRSKSNEDYRKKRERHNQSSDSERQKNKKHKKKHKNYK